MKIQLQKSSGFTLIELSIVLVIIGLIVGGVLVGRDLIKGAALRATISQLEKYNAAANTFRGKYNGVPGDISNPGRFGLAHAADRDGSAGMSDGDGILTAGCPSAGALFAGCGEVAMFWNDLATTNLIGDALTASTALKPGANITGSTLDNWIPRAKLGGQSYIVVGSDASLNYFLINGVTQIATADAFYSLQYSLSPMDSYSIDAKMDDGNPDSGIVQAYITVAVQLPGSGSPFSSCWDSTRSLYFTDDPDYKDVINCSVRVRSSF